MAVDHQMRHDGTVRRLTVLVALALGCEPFGSPNQNHTRSVEGCNDAVQHLRACCPAWDSYLSCTYLDNATATPDLSPGESRCLVAKSCEEIAAAIEGGHYLCSRTFATNHCR